MSTQTLPAPSTSLTEVISYYPATGAEIGRAPLASASEVQQAVERARRAQPAWGALSYRQRARVILKGRELMLAERDELAVLISRETGKPTVEALSMEIVPTLDAMHYFAGAAQQL